MDRKKEQRATNSERNENEMEQDFINRNDDLISRSAVLKMFPVNLDAPLWHVTGIRAEIGAVDAVDAVPVVHAQWKALAIGNHKAVFCSNCGFTNIFKANYCSRCGARMDGEENEID